MIQVLGTFLTFPTLQRNNDWKEQQTNVILPSKAVYFSNVKALPPHVSLSSFTVLSAQGPQEMAKPSNSTLEPGKHAEWGDSTELEQFPSDCSNCQHYY
jgi:hypothetical protein